MALRLEKRGATGNAIVTQVEKIEALRLGQGYHKNERLLGRSLCRNRGPEISQNRKSPLGGGGTPGKAVVM